MHLEPRFVQPVCHHRKYILNKRKEILLVKGLGNVWSSSDVLQKLMKDIQTSVRNISLCVFHRPNNRMNHELLVLGRDVEKSWETVLVYCLQGDAS
jgi:hypothetical protein